MNTILRVKIENFQSHEDTEIEFHNSLNVIVGQSDSGKSAIIRAIKWVLFNEPRGNDFIRQGSNFARVSLKISNGFSIIRERSQTKNKYVLVKPDETEVVFEGFGNEIPEEIIKAHGIPKLNIDSDLNCSINIAEQLEGPFLLSNNGAQRAKIIGRLMGLHVIDKAIANNLTDLSNQKKNITRLEQEESQIVKKLEDYEGLESLGERLHFVQDYLEMLDNLLKKIELSITLRDSPKNCMEEKKYLIGVLGKLKNIDEISVDIQSCENRAIKLKLAQSNKNKLNDINSGIKISSELIDKTHNLNELPSFVHKIESLKEKYLKLFKLKGAFISMQRELSSINTIIEQTIETNEIEKDVLISLEKNIKISKLRQCADKLLQIDSSINKADVFFRKIQNIEEGEKLLVVQSSNLNKLNLIEKAKLRYFEVVINIEKIALELNEIMHDNKKDLEEYALLLRKIGKCPFCKSEINEERLKLLIPEN